MVLFTPQEADNISFAADGKAQISVDKYALTILIKIYERRQTMRYARLSFFRFLKAVLFLFRKVKLWYTKVQKRQKQIIS